MDESLSRTVIDFSGRPELVWKVELGLENWRNGHRAFQRVF